MRRMSSSRSRPSSSHRNASSSSRLRMDRNPVHTRINDPSLPATKRREIDNVMRKARASTSNGQWDKKLIEVEERDPNRWRHTGYKALYIEGESSSGEDSSKRKSRSRSRGRAKSPVTRRRTPPPKSRDPPKKQHGRRPPSPSKVRQHKDARSPSASSLSSCSDDSCSVCSPKTRRHHRSRSRSFSVPRSRPPPQASTKTKPAPPRARPLTPPSKVQPKPKRREERTLPASKPPATTGNKAVRSRPFSVVSPPELHVSALKKRRHIDVPRPKQLPPADVPTINNSKKKDKARDRVQPLQARIKIEGSARQRPASPDSSGSDSSDSITSCPTASTRITLSERFGKMAQWSIDRRDIENMRITKDSGGGDLKVMIEDGGGYQSPRRYGSPAPPGHYPEELSATGPLGLSSWDDVRVRYDYYKGRGYLRDLDLQDYVKWEEWWYRYQDWLKQERYYEQWHRHGPRRRRKRVPIAQRLH